MYPTIFPYIPILKEKKKKEVNPLLFTVNITQTDKQGNEAENQGAIKVSPKPQGTVYT